MCVNGIDFAKIVASTTVVPSNFTKRSNETTQSPHTIFTITSLGRHDTDTSLDRPTPVCPLELSRVPEMLLCARSCPTSRSTPAQRSPTRPRGKPRSRDSAALLYPHDRHRYCGTVCWTTSDRSRHNGPLNCITCQRNQDISRAVSSRQSQKAPTKALGRWHTTMECRAQTPRSRPPSASAPCQTESPESRTSGWWDPRTTS